MTTTTSIYLAMTATWPGSWATGKTPDVARRRLREIHGKLVRGRVSVYRFAATAEPTIDNLGRLSAKSDPEHVSGPDLYGVAAELSVEGETDQ